LIFFCFSYSEVQLENAVEQEEAGSIMEFCPTLPDHDYVVKSPESHESQLHAAHIRIQELEEEVIQFKAGQFGFGSVWI